MVPWTIDIIQVDIYHVSMTWHIECCYLATPGMHNPDGHSWSHKAVRTYVSTRQWDPHRQASLRFFSITWSKAMGISFHIFCMIAFVSFPCPSSCLRFSIYVLHTKYVKAFLEHKFPVLWSPFIYSKQFSHEHLKRQTFHWYA